jgi:hypothetical protein
MVAIRLCDEADDESRSGVFADIRPCLGRLGRLYSSSPPRWHSR